MGAARRFPSALQMLLLVSCGLALMLGPVMRDVLPARFLFDDGHVRAVIDNPGLAPEDPSFHVLANFYRTLGIATSPAIASTLAIFLLVIAVFLAVSFSEWNRVGLVGAILLGLTLGLGLVYLAQYTKELFSLLVTLSILLALRVKNNWVRFPLVMAGPVMYGVLVRPYWLIIAALIPVVYLVVRKTTNPLVLIGCVVLAYVGLAIAFEVWRGEQLGATREWVNLGRQDTEVASLISTPDFGSSYFAGVLAILVVAGQMLVPVPLFAMADPYYVVAGLAIFGLWALVGHTLTSGRCRTDAGAAWLAAVLVSLFLVLVIFEPDYGSYIKHLTPFLPLFLALAPRRRRKQPELHRQFAFDDEVSAGWEASPIHRAELTAIQEASR
ncbi:hypothetical protein KACC15558_23830 [Brevibacterium ammoniilyticum]|uniref:DUF2029 domain-containing protein n=1 Tax=Brevibacterium ammoniilyticum TaxID=1046555 RepID=A0ABP9U5K4_9MICO